MIDIEPLIASSFERIFPQPDAEADWDEVLRRASVRTRSGRSTQTWRRWLMASLAIAAGLAAVLVATPAWALISEALPFGNQPEAPSSVKVIFSSLNVGAPAGMNPKAASGNTREVAQSTFLGHTRTLWVSPAKNGGFCFFWLPALPGGCTTPDQPLAWVGVAIPPHEPSQPAQTTDIPASETEGQVLEWIGGDAISPTVRDVIIRFSDGSSVRPHIIWVSAPINAGFFGYDVPADQQSSQDHAVGIDAYDQNGKLVKEQTLNLS